MKMIFMVVICYLLCRYVKPIWKGLIIGAILDIIISYIIMAANIAPNSKLNLKSKALSMFALGTFAEFLAYFIMGFIIYLIFRKARKAENDIIESDENISKNDNPLT